jgi:hypothetical protein
VVQKVKARGLMLAGTATTVDEAMALERGGIDVAECLSLWAGQGVRMARRTKAADLVAALVEETDAAIRKLQPRWKSKPAEPRSRRSRGASHGAGSFSPRDEAGPARYRSHVPALYRLLAEVCDRVLLVVLPDSAGAAAGNPHRQQR